jgi:hypothetical protein
MDAVFALAPGGGLTAACDALGASRASVYRRRSHLAQPPVEPVPRPSPPRALSVAERQTVLDLLRELRFADLAPAEIYATLLDDPTSFSISSAAGSSAGASPMPKAPSCSRHCSMTPSKSTPCRPAN